MSQVNFIYNGIHTTILCSTNETMKEIATRYTIKIQKNLDDLIFLFGGVELSLNLKYNQICGQQKKINILVYDKHSTIINIKNKLKLSKDIICPECGEICLIIFKDYKIKLYGCKNNHKKYTSMNDYEETQKIDESKIFCNICKKKKSESYNNKFFICGKCNVNCCPLCSSIHAKEHILIDYENKNYLCIKHNEQFISYCDICKYNLCLQCELEHNNSHKIIPYKSIYPNLSDIKNKLKNIENIIIAFNDDINKIIDILNKIKNNINEYYEINYKILNSFEINKRNYQILQNINNINDTNIITKNLNSIIKENNCAVKFNKIYDLYSNIYKHKYPIVNFYNNIMDNNNKSKPKTNKIINDSDDNSINNIKKLKFLNQNIINDSYAKYALDNVFCAFKSYDNILYLVYANHSKSIVFYNLLKMKLIKTIENAHEKYISNFRHFFDNKSKTDYIISVSCFNCNIKLWDINSDHCLFDIRAYKSGYIDSACFLSNENENYILITNSFSDDSENIKLLNFNGDKIGKIENSNERTYFIDTYYDNHLEKNFIVTGNRGYLKSYDFYNKKLYHKYYDNENDNDSNIITINNKKIKIGYFSALVFADKKMIKLISSCLDGFIRIWDFHSAKLLEKINLDSGKLYGICLFDKNNLLIGCESKIITLLNINSLKIITKLEGHQKTILTIKKINHNTYGECFLSGGYGESGQIKLWTIDE